jgi:hypothetical protein
MHIIGNRVKRSEKGAKDSTVFASNLSPQKTQQPVAGIAFGRGA